MAGYKETELFHILLQLIKFKWRTGNKIIGGRNFTKLVLCIYESSFTAAEDGDGNVCNGDLERKSRMGETNASMETVVQH